MSLEPGQVLSTYEISGLLGKGGMGEVYRATDRKLNRQVAIKILPAEFASDEDRVARFHREAQTVAALNHPNIAGIHELGEANGTRFLVLELVEGETLAERIARGPIPLTESLNIASQICDALAAAHEKGLIHRDLKPANIKLTADLPIMGGVPEKIADAPNSVTGASWHANDILVGFAGPDGIQKVDASGGVMVKVTEKSGNQSSHRLPYFLPDGRHFLFYVCESLCGDATAGHAIYLGSVDSKDTRKLLDATSGAQFSNGHIFFRRDLVLLAQAFDLATLQLSGIPVRVAETQPAGTAAGYLNFSISGDTLIYATRGAAPALAQLAWFDLQGKLLESVGEPGYYQGIDVASDGRRIAAHVHNDRGGDIWVSGAQKGTLSRFTFDDLQHNSAPVWSPDGSKILFASLRDGKWAFYQKQATGAEAEQLLYGGRLVPGTGPLSWSSDGRWILYVSESANLYLLPVSPDPKPIPAANTPFREAHGSISPDNKWVAYESDEQGNRMEIYVKPLDPTLKGHWQVTTAGGREPRWARGGSQLFYLNDNKFNVAEVDGRGVAFQTRSTRTLFDFSESGFGYFTGFVGVAWSYAVSPDGQRILFPSTPPGKNVENPGSAPIAVVLDWRSLIRN